MAVPVDTLATTTLQLVRKKLADNVFKANPFGAFMLAKDRVKVENGGKRIDEPLIYAQNTLVQPYKGYDRLAVAPTEELTTASFNWRQAAVPISMSGLEDLENDGEAKLFSMLQAKIKVADMSIRQWFAEKLLAASSTKDLSRDFLGLDELVEDVTGASQGVIGGISRATETWWQNRFIPATTFTSLGASTTLLTKYLNKAYLDVTRGLIQPDLILVDQFLFQRYEDDNRQFLRLMDTGMMDVGFMNFKFKNAIMMWDENMQTLSPATNHLAYFLTTDFLSVTIHARRNFVMTPFVTPYDQDAKVAQILLAGNTTVSNSRFQGANVIAE